MSDINDLASSLFGTSRAEVASGGTSTLYGTAATDSSGGSVSVRMGADTLRADGQAGTPVPVPTTTDVRAGETVIVTVVDGHPVVTGVVGAGDREREERNAAIAAANKEIADFRSDINTRVEQVSETVDTHSEWRKTFTDTYLNDERPDTHLVDRSTLDQTASSITSTVAETYETKDDAAKTYATQTTVTQTATDLTTKISGITVGGRNLVLGTGVAKTFTSPAIAAGSYTTWDPYDMAAAWSALGVKAGDPLTLTFDWAATGAVAGATLKVGASAKPWEFFGLVVTLAAGSSSGHVSTTLAAPSQLTTSTGSKFHVRIDAVGNAIAAGMTITLSHVKIERGNKATDWTPAPEDTSTLIREYGDGVLVANGSKRQPIGTLQGKDAFSINKLSWDGGTPTAGTSIASFSATDSDGMTYAHLNSSMGVLSIGETCGRAIMGVGDDTVAEVGVDDASGAWMLAINGNGVGSYANSVSVDSNGVSLVGNITAMNPYTMTAFSIPSSTPSSDKWSTALRVTDSDDNVVAGVQAFSFASGVRGIRLLSRGSNNKADNGLNIGVDASGNPVVRVNQGKSNAWHAWLAAITNDKGTILRQTLSTGVVLECCAGTAVLHVDGVKHATGYWGTVSLGTVPAGYRPKQAVRGAAVRQNELGSIAINVATDGNVTLANLSGSTYGTRQPCSGTVTWIYA